MLVKVKTFKFKNGFELTEDKEIVLSTHVIQSIIGVTAYRATNGEVLLPYPRMPETEKIGYRIAEDFYCLKTNDKSYIVQLPDTSPLLQ